MNPTITTTTAADTALLEGLRRSDSRAIRTIYDHVLPSVILYCKRNSGSEADARDVFQEALMALFQRLRDADFALTCTLRSYLRVVCRNLWLKRLHKVARMEGVLPEGLEETDLDPLMDARLEASERAQLFWRYFDTLEEGCRRILTRFFAGESMREIAQDLATSEGYVKKRKHTCKERLVAAVRADARYNELLT